MIDNVQFDDHTATAVSTIERDASLLVRDTAHAVEGDIKSAMAAPHHGAQYGAHTASAAGEAPAIDTGALVNSVEVANDDTGDGMFASETGSSMEYASLLEEGTTHIAPRPAFGNAGERAVNTFQRNAQRIR